MRTTVITSLSVFLHRYRLDSNSYISGSAAFTTYLNRLSIDKEILHTLTLNNSRASLKIKSRIPRQRINESDEGLPFLAVADILGADVRDESWILIPNSGALGQVVYCHSDMSETAAAKNILRIIPDPNKILPGYLYAFLSSLPGESLLASGTYGSARPRISTHYLAQLPVPRLGKLETECHDLCMRAAALRVKASSMLKEAGSLVNDYFRFPATLTSSHQRVSGAFPAASTSSLRLRFRMDATFYNASALESDRYIASASLTERLSELVEIHNTDKLRSAFIFEKHGIPLISKSDILHFSYKPTRFLTRDCLPPDEKWAVHESDILFTQRNLHSVSTCRGLYADRRYHRSCPLPGIFHLKILGKHIPSGYLYAYLFLTDLGYQQVIRTLVKSSPPHFSHKDLLAILIPRASNTKEKKIHALVQEAGQLRAEAQSKEDRARQYIEQAIQWRTYP